MDIAIAFIFVLFGLVVGSFLNVVIDRLPAGQSLAFPPSHCPSCKKRLAVKDLIPVLSYGWLGGRCRYCRERIPMRLPLVEAATGVAFGLVFVYFGFSPELAIALFYFCLLLVVAVIDLEQKIIFPLMILPAIALSLVFSLLLPHSSVIPDIKSALIGGAIGLGIILLIYVFAYIRYHGDSAFGLGDVYLGALLGVILGTPKIIVGVLLAIYIGGIAAILLIALRAKTLKQIIAFGPILTIGTGIAFIWGTPIWNWYTTLFGF
jgi:prepilin signal peptidase PulO-like enzyme (type II secretory pathway)